MKFDIYTLLEQHGMKKFFEDCIHTKTSEGDQRHAVYNLMLEGQTQGSIEWTKAIEKLIQIFEINVNLPCASSGQDLMYQAIMSGTAEDVRMLFRNGYNGTNFISGRSAYTYLQHVAQKGLIDDGAEKIRIFQTFNMDKIEQKDRLPIEEEKIAYMNNVVIPSKRNGKELTAEQTNMVKKYSPLAYSVFQEYVGLNVINAKAKFLEKLIELGCSSEDIISICENGSFVDMQYLNITGKERNLPIYKQLLMSEGIPLPNNDHVSY